MPSVSHPSRALILTAFIGLLSLISGATLAQGFWFVGDE
jgi:hypothetical protein